MAILAFDTCLPSCSVALVAGGNVLFTRRQDGARGQAEALPAIVAAAFAETGVGMADISRVAVTRGPGSFTGLRAGLAFARALVIGHDAVTIGFSTLEVIAGGHSLHEGAVLGVLIDARRGQLYGQLFSAAAVAVSVPFILEPEQAREKLEYEAAGRDLVLAGNGVPLAFPARAEEFAWDRQFPDPVVLARLCADAALPDLPPSPVYLRAPDAKPQKSSSQ